MYQNLMPKAGGSNLSEEVKASGGPKSPHNCTWLSSYRTGRMPQTPVKRTYKGVEAISRRLRAIPGLRSGRSPRAWQESIGCHVLFHFPAPLRYTVPGRIARVASEHAGTASSKPLTGNRLNTGFPVSHGTVRHGKARPPWNNPTLYRPRLSESSNLVVFRTIRW